jgi:CubicO group peptidase (beta-lactamase class C family)
MATATLSERIVEPTLGVSTSNWLAPPYNRWGFHHVQDLTRTERISRGDGPVRELPRADEDLGGFVFAHEGGRFTLEEMFERTYTDAFLVLREGSIRYERYFGAMTDADPHLLMSESKSLTSTLCGVFAGRGLLEPGDHVVSHLPELRGTAWEGCTIQHLLDMRAGIEWDYDIDEYTILDVSAYRTHVREGIPPDTAAWIRSVRSGPGHGGPFRYISLATDTLGWLLERVGGGTFASLFGREIWSRLGVEHDAFIMVDAEGFPVVEGGICTTLRDLGRFGQMCLNDGVVDGLEVVPSAWLRRVASSDKRLIAEFRASVEANPARPDAFYHDCWWIWNAERGVYKAAGMNGQAMLVHRPSRTVVVKFSSHPGALDAPLFALQDAGMEALCESLVG